MGLSFHIHVNLNLELKFTSYEIKNGLVNSIFLKIINMLFIVKCIYEYIIWITWTILIKNVMKLVTITFDRHLHVDIR